MKSFAVLFAAIAVATIGNAQNTYPFPASGNVGIGTVTPLAPIEVRTSATPALLLSGTIGRRLQIFGLQDNANAYMGLGVDMSGGPYEHSIYYPAISGSKLTIGTYNGTIYSEKVRIDTSGNVGIGTMNPEEKLDVNGHSSAILVKDDVTDWNIGGSPVTLSRIKVRSYQSDESNGNYAASAIEYNANFAGTIANLARIGARLNPGWGGTLEFDVSPGGGPTPAYVRAMTIKRDGNVGIGTTTPSEKLSVNGRIRAKEVIVDTNWSDYVFAKDYKLPSLSEVEQHITQKGHLPGVPSAAQVAEKGVSVGDMQALLLAKIEELTLHQIAQEKRMATQDARLQALEAENIRLKKQAQ